MIKIKQTIRLSLITIWLLILIILPLSVKANDKVGDHLTFSANVNCTITNDKGEFFTYKDFDTTGNMKILGKSFSVDGESKEFIKINSSTSYVYVNHTNKDINLTVSGQYTFGTIEAKNTKKVTIENDDGIRSIILEGKNIKFTVGTTIKNSRGASLVITGQATNKVEIKDTKQGILVTGLTGLTQIEADDLKDRKNSIRKVNFVPLAQPVIINLTNPIELTNAVRVNMKTATGISNFHVIVPQKETAFLTWDRVKNATGYYIYRYDPRMDNYRMIANQKANNLNYYLDRKVSQDKAYKYQIQAYRYQNGKKFFITKRSYWVNTVVGPTKKGNANKVILNKTGTIKQKTGKTYKLKATVHTGAGKSLYSNNVRWVTSNDNIASIDKTGKLMFKKKGTCYIWAKAHNGFNSKSSQVIVK